MTLSVLDLGGIVLSVEDTGRGVPVLLLHGNPDSREPWDGVVGALGAVPPRLIRPVMPGFDASPPPPPEALYTSG